MNLIGIDIDSLPGPPATMKIEPPRFNPSRIMPLASAYTNLFTLLSRVDKSSKDAALIKETLDHVHKVLFSPEEDVTHTPSPVPLYFYLLLVVGMFFMWVYGHYKLQGLAERISAVEKIEKPEALQE